MKITLQKFRLGARQSLTGHGRNKSDQDKLLLNLKHLSFFSLKKIGNNELYKVPIGRLHVRNACSSKTNGHRRLCKSVWDK